MASTTVRVRILDLILIVEGSYQPAEPSTMTDPGCDESFEVERVTTASGDVITALFEDDAHDIEALCLEAIHDEWEGAKAENEERRREDRLAG